MAYVRRLVSEHWERNRVIRRYEVETLEWHYEWDLDAEFPRLVQLERRVSRECVEYFRKIPYSLAETIWIQGLRPSCFRPFCCFCDYGVL